MSVRAALLGGGFLFGMAGACSDAATSPASVDGGVLADSRSEAALSGDCPELTAETGYIGSVLESELPSGACVFTSACIYAVREVCASCPSITRYHEYTCTCAEGATECKLTAAAATACACRDAGSSD